jgi:hypothetical protein
MTDGRQYIRKCTLIIADKAGNGLDLSNLRIVFSIKRSDAQTPNTAEIRVYNLSDETVNRLKKEFTHVTLQAGYESNYGVIFSGNIKQIRSGREDGTDSFIDIAAGDGDEAYNYAVVNTTLAAGSTQKAQIGAAAKPMESKSVKQGFIDETGVVKLPRGKVMYGMARDYLRQSAKATDTSWSIQDGKIQVIKLTGVLPNQVVVLNSKTGLIGTPEQTNDGIKTRCLLNPTLKIGGKVKINESDVAEAALPDTSKKDDVNKSVSIEKDGFYRLLVVEHKGDTRGNDWYSDLMCLGVDATQPPSKQVKLNG